MTDSHIEINKVCFNYNQDQKNVVEALKDITFKVDGTAFVTVIGPSGCGKSTLLSLIDGLMKPTSGDVKIKGQTVSGPGPDRAMVFQDFALLPWRTVEGNIKFGLELQKKPIDNSIISHYVELLGLKGFEKHYPRQLSGGMRQRVGVGRALVVNPEILLMDEPFGSLDAQTRVIMGEEITRIWESEKKTTLFVTHDLEEAIYLSDRIIVLSKRPAEILKVFNVSLARPRSHAMKLSKEFTELKQVLWELLRVELSGACNVSNKEIC